MSLECKKRNTNCVYVNIGQGSLIERRVYLVTKTTHKYASGPWSHSGCLQVVWHLMWYVVKLFCSPNNPSPASVISSGWFSYRVARNHLLIVSVVEERHSILKDVGYQNCIPTSGKVLKLNFHQNDTLLRVYLFHFSHVIGMIELDYSAKLENNCASVHL